MFTELLPEASALVQVIIVDLVLAGDNAIAVGLIAASVKPSMRKRLIATGIIAATIMRIVFAVSIAQLLKIPGLLLFGGLLLLWVCWRLYVEIRGHNEKKSHDVNAERLSGKSKFNSALIQILIADLSMSLDNVLAVAGIARDHLYILVFGLVLSVALMLVAATAIATQINKRPWIAYLGVAIIFYVACVMIWDGGQEVITLLDT